MGKSSRQQKKKNETRAAEPWSPKFNPLPVLAFILGPIFFAAPADRLLFALQAKSYLLFIILFSACIFLCNWAGGEHKKARSNATFYLGLLFGGVTSIASLKLLHVMLPIEIIYGLLAALTVQFALLYFNQRRMPAVHFVLRLIRHTLIGVLSCLLLGATNDVKSLLVIGALALALGAMIAAAEVARFIAERGPEFASQRYRQFYSILLCSGPTLVLTLCFYKKLPPSFIVAMIAVLAWATQLINRLDLRQKTAPIAASFLLQSTGICVLFTAMLLGAAFFG